MSALAKPMIHSSRATSGESVNVEEVLTFEKVVVTNPTGAVGSTFSLNFSMKAGSVPRNIVWAFASQVDLDADFLAVQGLISTVTP